MKIYYITENRYFKTFDGRIWSSTYQGYYWWPKLISVFSQVIVVARVKKIKRISKNYILVSGNNINFYELPNFIGPLGIVANLGKLIKRFKKLDYYGSAVIVNLPSIFSFFLIKILANYPYSVFVVGDPEKVYSRGVSKNFFRFFIQYYLTATQKILCNHTSTISYVTKNQLQKRYPANKAIFSNNFSDVDLCDNDFVKKSKVYKNNVSYQIVFVGNFYELCKGQIELIRSFTILNQVKKFHFTMIGGGKYLDKCKRLSKRLKINNLRFTGSVDRQKIINILRNSDVFILPSKSEGMPRALIEAMAQGIVCLSTPVGGISEILSKEQLIDQVSPWSIANKILKLTDNTPLMNKIAHRNLQISKKFNDTNQRIIREKFFSEIIKITTNYLSLGYDLQRPTITVIMSAYNAERYIVESVNSILGQSFRDFEIIIFDDASTDKTRDILKKMAIDDERIKLILKRKNYGQKGFINNLNHGLKLAKGKYIARMDADDISDLNRFKIQVKYLELHSEIFLVSSRAKIINENNKVLYFSKKIKNNKIKKYLEKKNVLFHSSIMFRNLKDFQLKYRSKILFGQDYDLYLRLILAKKRIIQLNQLLIKFRVQKNLKKDLKKRTFQLLFGKISRHFYSQKLKRGFDDYQIFDPKNILNINFQSTKIKDLLELQISQSLKEQNTKKTLKLFRIYFQNHKPSIKILFFYLLFRFNIIFILLRYYKIKFYFYLIIIWFIHF